MRYCLAIDIGASSGRHIVGWKEGGQLRTKEVYRFPNRALTQGGHLVWDVEGLLASVETGIEQALEKFPEMSSLSIDTPASRNSSITSGSWSLSCWVYWERLTPWRGWR